MEKHVRRGDIIRLEEGMTVSTLIPESIFLPDKPFSLNKMKAIVEIGKVYSSIPFPKNIMVDRIDRLFEETGIYVERSKIEDFVDSIEIIQNRVKEFDTSIFIGDYFVYKAGYEESTERLYKVHCYNIANSLLDVEFFQNTSSYTLSNIKKFKVIGHVEI